MKLVATLVLSVCTHFFCFAQKNTSEAYADQIALSIPAALTNSTASIAAYFNEHLQTEEQKVRAAYTWVATNIRYDASHLHRVILDEDHAEKVTWSLERKKGVCENFSAIFTDICLQCGVRSYTVEGYTKNGTVDRTGHAWSAAYVNNKWLLFDPTWDAGFARRGASPSAGVTHYYQIEPQEFIQTHLPFDPMLQFLANPITFQEFSRGVHFTKERTYFNFKDSIDAYENMEPLARYISSAARIEKNGSPTTLTATRLAQLRMEKEIIYQDNDVILYNEAVEDYKYALQQFRDYLTFRNNQFQPARPLQETKTLLKDISGRIAKASEKLEVINRSKARLQLNTGDIDQMLRDLDAKVNNEKNFLDDYFSAAK